MPILHTKSLNFILFSRVCFDNFRVEAEVGYQKNNSDTYTFSRGTVPLSGNFSVTSYMLNSYYDFKTDTVKPYLSVGLGLAEVSLDKVPDPPDVVTETRSALGYQFGAGVAIPLSKTIDLDARYRYFSTADFRMDDGYDTHFASNSLLLGLRVSL